MIISTRSALRANGAGRQAPLLCEFIVFLSVCRLGNTIISTMEGGGKDWDCSFPIADPILVPYPKRLSPSDRK